MTTITRHEINEDWALAGMVEAGGFIFVSYCVGNIGQPIEAQINGAFDNLSERLSTIGLTLQSVVKIDALFRDVWDIPVMENVMKQRFHGQFPARKSIQTEFAHRGGTSGMLFQLDAIACR
ncbi:RidA family protein [Citrobacter amalonaticus]|nr:MULTISPECIES: RidA family protein [Citrobacter]KEY46724.1 endoribonuclease L-PSP [Citrobacter amalonaticus]MBJ9325689.1 RidA family protein [Citrobacter amalonaticus]MBY5256894.1 RidA family protein [Citrobacter amalonaticus]MCK8152503.1 RidA family protein [Citrobacter amalonaticus]MDT7070941.1 RidA family protein [Citrobacter amalonaticus]